MITIDNARASSGSTIYDIYLSGTNRCIGSIIVIYNSLDVQAKVYYVPTVSYRSEVDWVSSDDMREIVEQMSIIEKNGGLLPLKNP